MSSLVVLPLAVVANGGSVKYSAQLIGACCWKFVVAEKAKVTLGQG